MLSSEAIRIQYESKYAHSSNYWKNSIGMNKCIDSIGLIQQKRQFENKIRQWQDSTGYLKGKLDFDKLAKLYQQRFQSVRALYYWNETWGRECDQLSVRAKKVHSGIAVQGPTDKKKKQYVTFDDNSKEWDQETDRELLAAMMKNYRQHVDQKYHIDVFKTIDRDFKGDYRAYVDYVYDKSMLMKSGKKLYINKKKFDKDPGVIYGQDLIELRAILRADLLAIADSIEQQEQWLCAAKLRMEQDLPNYSDANFTMRMTYGQVGEYSLGGKPSGYYTTARSLWEKMQKADQNVEYYAEPVMHELLSSNDFGPYGDKETGTMQLCFLSNNDITGGNSGSPIFNGKGELLGLAFDGNWDSLSSDIFFDRQLARTINVDVRYMLFMMDRWGHADRLIKEINAK